MKVETLSHTTSSPSHNEYSGKKSTSILTAESDGFKVSSVTTITYSIMNTADKRKYPVEETVDRIINLTEELTIFWKSSKGWAPIEAANLLTKSRLDWQASLARQLKLFLDKSNSESGFLILAWTTLGSLTEGALKLFLSVYYKVYQTQNLAKEFKPVKDKKGNLIDPDSLMLDKLRLFFKERVFPKDAKEQWEKQGEIDWLEWISKIQSRRNAIHAFRNKDIGTIDEFHSELSNYLIFLRKINNGLPYPDEPYIPVEHISDKCSETVGLKTETGWIQGTIKRGKLHVTSKENSDFLKEHLGDFLKEKLYNPDEIQIVDDSFFRD